MKVGLYAVLDSASAVYDGPVPSHNDEVAVRNFGNMAKNPQSAISQNPECFSLWKVGEWNDGDAQVLPLKDGKVCLINAVDLLNKEKLDA